MKQPLRGIQQNIFSETCNQNFSKILVKSSFYSKVQAPILQNDFYSKIFFQFPCTGNFAISRGTFWNN